MDTFETWDNQAKVNVPGTRDETLAFAAEHLIKCYHEAIESHNAFYIALSGGSTPKALFGLLTSPKYVKEIDWHKVHLFWSDERSVLPEDPDSNYKMAMDSGFASVSIPEKQIHRMHAEENIEKNAALYEKTIKQTLGDKPFDFVMLGMGDDGHTASLFPNTKALDETEKLVVANEVPQKETTRMTFTFPLINKAHHIAIYLMGASKAEMAMQVLYEKNPNNFLPVRRIGTKENPALWILDKDAAERLI